MRDPLGRFTNPRKYNLDQLAFLIPEFKRMAIAARDAGDVAEWKAMGSEFCAMLRAKRALEALPANADTETVFSAIERALVKPNYNWVTPE